MGRKNISISVTITLLLLSLSMIAQVNCMTTKYYIDLPTSFLQTLQKTDDAKVELWHPSLSIRKVVLPLSETIDEHPMLKKKFSSLIQMAAKETDGQDLTFLSSTGNIVSPQVDGLKMACQCRFVKDPSSPSFIQTNQKVMIQSNNNYYDDSIGARSSQPMGNNVDRFERDTILAETSSNTNPLPNRKSEYEGTTFGKGVQQRGFRSDDESYRNYNNMPMNTNQREPVSQILADRKPSNDAEIIEFFEKYKDFKAHQAVAGDSMLFAQTNQRTSKMSYSGYDEAANFGPSSGYSNNNNLRTSDPYYGDRQRLVSDRNNAGYDVRSPNQMTDNRIYENRNNFGDGIGYTKLVDERRPIANQRYDNSYSGNVQSDRNFLDDNYVPAPQQRSYTPF